MEDLSNIHNLRQYIIKLASPPLYLFLETDFWESRQCQNLRCFRTTSQDVLLTSKEKVYARSKKYIKSFFLTAWSTTHVHVMDILNRLRRPCLFRPKFAGLLDPCPSLRHCCVCQRLSQSNFSVSAYCTPLPSAYNHPSISSREGLLHSP